MWRHAPGGTALDANGATIELCTQIVEGVGARWAVMKQQALVNDCRRRMASEDPLAEQADSEDREKEQSRLRGHRQASSRRGPVKTVHKGEDPEKKQTGSDHKHRDGDQVLKLESRTDTSVQCHATSSGDMFVYFGRQAGDAAPKREDLAVNGDDSHGAPPMIEWRLPDEHVPCAEEKGLVLGHWRGHGCWGGESFQAAPHSGHRVQWSAGSGFAPVRSWAQDGHRF